MSLIRLFATVSFLLAISSATASSGTWVRRARFLDADRRFHMEWEIEDNEEIVFKLEVRTRGLVALGFSKDGTMVDSDVVVGWVSEGKVFLQDRHGEGNQMPELDEHQDYELISGSENATHTTIVFSRKWNTCDDQDFELEHDNTVRVMHAYTVDDPYDDINIPFRQFVSRGWTSLVLMEPDTPMEPDVEYWDILTNNISVRPEWDTMYWCKLVKAPALAQKHHITRVEKRILGGLQGDYVHHTVLYECPGANPSEFERYVDGDGYDCFGSNPPIFISQCIFPSTAAWAIGGEGWTLQDHIGIPLDPRSNKYYMLQLHLDNTNRDTGTPGRAGFRLYHTQNLRQYDGGFMTVGVDFQPIVAAPPGIPDFVVAAHSNPDCMGPSVPPEGIRINMAGLHTHLLGRRLKVRHFRKNVELPPLIDNKHFDPSYQQFHTLTEERTFLPRDQMTLECTYDSTTRNATTLSGYSTREEMCFVFVVYYPLMKDMHFSWSYPAKSTTTKYLGSQELTSLTAGEPDYSQTFIDYMRTYDWNRTAIRRFEHKIRYSEQITTCGSLNTETETTISYPEDLRKYVEKSSCLREENKYSKG